MNTPSKPRLYAILYITFVVLGGVVAFAAIPPFRLWALGTIPGLLLVLYSLAKKQNRTLLTASYGVLALLGIAIGQVFWQGESLSENGLVMLLVAVPIIGFTLARIAVVELDEA